MAWNKVTQTPSLPIRLEPPPQPNSYHMPQTHVRVAARCTFIKPQLGTRELQ